jgi:FtsP/CotA-like multicopper oxidase with cupredoxin domain
MIRPMTPGSVSRRRLIKSAGAGLVSVALSGLQRGAVAAPKDQTVDGFRVLRARPGTATLRGPNAQPTAIWGYDGTVPGPTLRVKRGEDVRVRLLNELPEATVIHWHGLRLPNAMDGVPHLTQPPVEPGASFDYRFACKDAGTFWFHSHLCSSEQLERGLYGVLIVDEPDPVGVDQDIVLVIDDWRLNADGAIDDKTFRSFHDAAHAGRLGGHVTVNSAPSLDIPVKTNERLRLRLLNSANARVFVVRVDRHAARVMAIDGQPAETFLARDGRVVLAPGTRIDLFVDAALAPGESAPILVEDLRRNEIPLARLVYEAGGMARPAPRADPKPLPANPLPARMDFKGALKLDVPLEGGAMSELMRRGMMGQGAETPGHGIDPRARIWTLAGFASSGHHGPPLFTVKRGRTVMLGFANNTAFAHAMHVHGHHFRLLDRLDDGWKPYWLDTVLVESRQTARIAFVADNPGKWMIHCHMLEHQETGMAAWFEVT